jgi:phosphohistidine phosphatase
VSETTHLYLLRHGDALHEDEDPARPLSSRGQMQVRVVADFVRARGGIRVERVWHSPLRRATETAELFCDRLELAATRREIDGLLPDDDIRGVARRLSGFGYPLLVVGHEPHLGRLASILVCGNVDQELVDFATGGLLCLERESTKSRTILWRIRWFITPGLLADEDAGTGASDG